MCHLIKKKRKKKEFLVSCIGDCNNFPLFYSKLDYSEMVLFGWM